ncbi:hypothetical protein D3C84_1029010 [compost metagenome]
MLANGFSDLVAYCHGRVKRCHWLLENHCYGITTQSSHLLFRNWSQISTFEQDLATAVARAPFG